jgi:hypothetical protein
MPEREALNVTCSVDPLKGAASSECFNYDCHLNLNLELQFVSTSRSTFISALTFN